eukprot:6931717-Prymnesium_polylepis.1
MRRGVWRPTRGPGGSHDPAAVAAREERVATTVGRVETRVATATMAGAAARRHTSPSPARPPRPRCSRGRRYTRRRTTATTPPHLRRRATHRP